MEQDLQTGQTHLPWICKKLIMQTAFPGGKLIVLLPMTDENRRCNEER